MFPTVVLARLPLSSTYSTCQSRPGLVGFSGFLLRLMMTGNSGGIQKYPGIPGFYGIYPEFWVKTGNYSRPENPTTLPRTNSCLILINLDPLQASSSSLFIDVLLRCYCYCSVLLSSVYVYLILEEIDVMPLSSIC
jgi:hypothetical protein